jgi:hypothetical protein
MRLLKASNPELTVVALAVPAIRNQIAHFGVWATSATIQVKNTCRVAPLNDICADNSLSNARCISGN